uniref:Uncharacterized protein n=1 Tax=Rhizophora mucronata TaxID=61149 RepID=A0A2P2QYJ1_RHIMU
MIARSATSSLNPTGNGSGSSELTISGRSTQRKLTLLRDSPFAISIRSLLVTWA